MKETRIESIAAFIASPIDELVNKPNLFPRNRNEMCLCTKKVTVITRNFHNASRNESVRKDSIAMVNRTRGMFIYHELVKCDLSRITLVVPCFNEEKALEALLASCKKFSNQTGVNFILVDNGSSESGIITEIRTKERPLDGQEWLPLIGSFTFSSLEVAKELLSKAT